MFKEYIVELIEKKFLEEKINPKSYSLSNKGFEFLLEYKKIVEFIDNFGL